MPWFHAVAERDHEIQNPTSREKIRLLGERLSLSTGAEVLDVGCGKGGPAIILARTFGVGITGVECAPEFASVARERVVAAGVGDLVQIVERDAGEFELEPQRYDVAMCLGASFVWNGLEATLAALTPSVRPGGRVVVGEPYWRRWPLPEGIADDGFASLDGTTGRFEAAGLRVEALIASSEDDWDRYESLHWGALEDWLDEHPDDPDAAGIRRRHEQVRADYLRWRRELFGWAIFVGRRRRR